jgi:hypothetical protein
MNDFDINELLREMREWADRDYPQIGAWADAIEAAMREPVMIARESGGGVAWIMDILKPDAMHHRMRLYALPPDAAAEIERLIANREALYNRLDDMRSQRDAANTVIVNLKAEIERCQDLVESAYHDGWRAALAATDPAP